MNRETSIYPQKQLNLSKNHGKMYIISKTKIVSSYIVAYCSIINSNLFIYIYIYIMLFCKKIE